jgi:hypothetical protein
VATGGGGGIFGGGGGGGGGSSGLICDNVVSVVFIGVKDLSSLSLLAIAEPISTSKISTIVPISAVVILLL